MHCLEPREGRWFCTGTTDTACSHQGQSCSPCPLLASPGPRAGLAGPGTMALEGSAGFCAPSPHSFALDSSSSLSENNSSRASGSLTEMYLLQCIYYQEACWYQQPLKKYSSSFLQGVCVCVCTCVFKAVCTGS